MLFVTTISTPRNFLNKPRALLGSHYVNLIHCVKPISKHLKANFKHLLGMELARDVIFLVLLPVNNDLFIYIFATGMGCEIAYVGNTGWNNVAYISAKVTCTISFSIKETWMPSKDVDTQFPWGEQISNLKRPLF